MKKMSFFLMLSFLALLTLCQTTHARAGQPPERVIPKGTVTPENKDKWLEKYTILRNAYMQDTHEVCWKWKIQKMRGQAKPGFSKIDEELAALLDGYEKNKELNFPDAIADSILEKYVTAAKRLASVAPREDIPMSRKSFIFGSDESEQEKPGTDGKTVRQLIFALDGECRYITMLIELEHDLGLKKKPD